MNQNRSPYDYRPIIVLAVLVLLAFVLLATLLAPGKLPLEQVLPTLVEILRLALKIHGES
jgi:hypothetical protein